jgi:hypothetical protein
MTNIEELKSEAASLGIKHNASISEGKLKEKIDAHYVSEETSGPALSSILAEEAEKEAETPKTVAKTLDPKTAKRIAREKAAKALRVVTILDNDQRSNSHTTTCSVNCSNSFFDLGTVFLPLGEKIEVMQGHLNVLTETEIPIHTKDAKTGLSTTKSRSRYSISYEDKQ